MPQASFLKRHFQVIYSIVLIVLIPISIALNTYYMVTEVKKTMDQELQWKALLAEQIFNITAVQELNTPEILQKKIEKIARESESIRALDVMIPIINKEKELNFQIIASLDKEFIGKYSKLTNNVLSWQRDEAIAYLTLSQAATTEKQTVRKDEISGERSWIVTKPLFDENQSKVGLVSLKLSLATVDNLVAQTLFKSYMILGITLLIILLIVANNTRLFQYAIWFKKIKEVDKMKDEFISIASHELRTPVTGIKGYLSMLLEGSGGKLNPKTRQILITVQSSVQRLNTLVNDLLDVSRIDQKRLKLELMPTKSLPIIEEIIEELNAEAKQKGIKLILTKPKRLPPMINLDADKFKQAMTNIIGNAVKYTPKGSVTIYTELSDNAISFKIKDTGLGMDAKARESLFQKFYRVETAETEKITGTGLGLWITKQLVELMNGEIYVDSIKGVGTEFTISFPLK